MEVSRTCVRRDRGYTPGDTDSRSMESLMRPRRYTMVAVSALRNEGNKRRISKSGQGDITWMY